jgi:hypothetical protein
MRMSFEHATQFGMLKNVLESLLNRSFGDKSPAHNHDFIATVY